jgi:CheY-like chemotaxis protein
MTSPFFHARPLILIVDDDPRIRELAEFAARNSGAFAAVQQAENGEHALAILRRSAAGENGHGLPDIILTDLSMPGIDGFELIEHLKHDMLTRDIPVVMFSSSGLPHDRERALAAGCLAFFEKPAGLSSLTGMMSSIGSLLKHA